MSGARDVRVPNDQPTAATPPAIPQSGTPAVIDSERLLQGAREVVILHLGNAYRLQATRSGKLILVK